MAPVATAASKPATSTRSVSVDVDLVRSYLRDIGRVPLLTHEQEITLGRQVQQLMEIETLEAELESCLLYTSPSPRDQRGCRMPSSA